MSYDVSDSAKDIIAKQFNYIVGNVLLEYYERITIEDLSSDLITDFLINIGYPDFFIIKNLIYNITSDEILKVIKEIVNKDSFISEYYDLYCYLCDVNTGEKIKKFLEVIVKFLIDEKALERKQTEPKKIFVCISLGDSSSVLDNDLLGKNSMIHLYGSEFPVASPHGHKFINGKSNDSKLAELFLEYLGQIEENLKNSHLRDRCRRHGTFQFESNTAVMRDTNNKIRIQLHEIDSYVFVVGIYYKDAKGAGNSDLIVQKEYENRTKFLEQVSKLSDEKFKEYILSCENAYQKFKNNLTALAYGDIISNVDSLREQIKGIVDSLIVKLDNGMEEGKGL